MTIDASIIESNIIEDFMKEKEDKMSEEISNMDLLKAMMGFKEDISKNISRLEGKMDTKFQEMAGEIKKIDDKMDDRMTRMDGRLDKLENEMRWFHFGRIKSQFFKTD